VFASYVEPAPSMIESPNATTAPASRDASTSTASRKTHWRRRVGKDAASVECVKSPAAERYPVAACGCDVVGTVASGRYRVITRSVSAGRPSGTGSLVTVEPAGTTTLASPENARER